MTGASLDFDSSVAEINRIAAPYVQCRFSTGDAEWQRL